jgi:hypothetical protein
VSDKIRTSVRLSSSQFITGNFPQRHLAPSNTKSTEIYSEHIQTYTKPRREDLHKGIATGYCRHL